MRVSGECVQVVQAAMRRLHCTTTLAAAADRRRRVALTALQNGLLVGRQHRRIARLASQTDQPVLDAVHGTRGASPRRAAWNRGAASGRLRQRPRCTSSDLLHQQRCEQRGQERRWSQGRPCHAARPRAGCCGCLHCPAGFICGLLLFGAEISGCVGSPRWRCSPRYRALLSLFCCAALS